MTHDLVFERLPDLLFDRDDPDLLAHVGSCHRCQRQLFLLSRVDRLLRQRRPQARRRRRLPAAFAIACVIAAAIVVAVALPQRRAASPARFALKTDGGAIVARAQIQRADAENGQPQRAVPRAFQPARHPPARPLLDYALDGASRDRCLNLIFPRGALTGGGPSLLSSPAVSPRSPGAHPPGALSPPR